MELRQLRYFVTLAEELHFGRAAARLHISQPPLSRQIQKLEQELGALLLTRDPRHVALTAAGAAFLGGARRTLEEADLAALMAQRALRGEIGPLRIGFVASAAWNVMPRLVRAYRTAYPKVEISLRALTTRKQCDLLQRRELDAGIMRESEDIAGLRTLALDREPLVALIPDSHPLREEGPLDLARLAGEPLIFYPRSDGPRIHDRIAGLCRAHGFEPQVVQESGETTTTVGLVAAGVGIALVIGHPGLVLAGVHTRIIADPSARWTLTLGWLQQSPSPTLETFVRTAQALLEAPLSISVEN